MEENHYDFITADYNAKCYFIEQESKAIVELQEQVRFIKAFRDGFIKFDTIREDMEEFEFEKNMLEKVSLNDITGTGLVNLHALIDKKQSCLFAFQKEFPNAKSYALKRETEKIVRIKQEITDIQEQSQLVKGILDGTIEFSTFTETYTYKDYNPNVLQKVHLKDLTLNTIRGLDKSMKSKQDEVDMIQSKIDTM